MGLFDSIFGGTENTVNPSPPQITNVPTLTGEQSDFLRALLGNLQGATGRGGRPEAFGGQLTADLSGLEEQGLGSIEDLLRSGSQTSNLVQRQLQEFDPQQTIDRFNEFQRPFAERNQDESRRRLLESFAGSGRFDSSGLTRAFARGETDFNLGLQSLLGQQINVDETRQLGQNQSGLSNLLNLQGQTLQGGGLERGVEQQGLDRILQQFLREQQPDPLLQLAGVGLGTSAFTPFIQTPDTAFGPSGLSQISSLIAGLTGGGDTSTTINV